MNSRQGRTARHATFAVAGAVCLACFCGFLWAWRCFEKDIRESRRFGSFVTSYLAEGRVEKALRIARIAYECDPIDPNAAAAYAKTLASAGRERAAVAQYQQLLSISARRNPKYNPNVRAPESPTLATDRPYFFPEARLELAKRGAERGGLIEALKDAELAQAFGQRIPKDYCPFLSGLYGALNLWGRAIPFRTPDVDVSDLPSGALLVFARCAAARGAWPECRAAAEEALRRTDNADARWWLGVASLALGRTEAAASELRLAADAGHPHAPFFLGWVRERLGENDRLAADYLRTSPDSPYRPFALAKAMVSSDDDLRKAPFMESADEGVPRGNAAAQEPQAAFERELEGYFDRPRPLPRPFMSDETRVHPVGFALEATAGDASIPVLLQVVWVDERAPEGAAGRSVSLDASRPLEPRLRNGRYLLELRLEANLVPFGTFGGIPAASGLPPGWPEIYALPKGRGAGRHFETVVEGGDARFRVSSDDTRTTIGARSVFLSVEAGRHYLLAVRCRSEKARLYAGWEWYDANETRLYNHNVFNQDMVPVLTWHTQYSRCPAAAAYVQAVVGIHRSMGAADFDAVLIFPLDPPPYPW